MNRATVARRIRANGMGVLGIWLLCCGGPGGLLAQRDSAATEAEMQDDRLAVERGDPHRDPDLGQLDPMASVFYGAEHIPQFLAAWNALLRGDATARQSTAPLEVVHFGGSHVQAGRIGWSFRQRLAADKPGLIIGRGIHPPHRLGRSNGPPERGWQSDAEWRLQSCANRNHSGEWGITGVEACQADTAAVRCWSGSPAGAHCCDAIRVFTRPDSSVKFRPMLAAGWHIDTALTGLHGITKWTATSGASAPDTLLLEAEATSGVLQGVEWRPRDVDFVFHDLGANGANATSWMRNPHFAAQLSAVDPGLVILAWGINDAHMVPRRFDPSRFLDHYRTLIATIRAAVPDAEILLVSNNDSHYRYRHNPNAQAVRDAMLSLVAPERVACWDLYNHLGGKGSIDVLHAAGYAAADRLHMRKDGYILMGELLYEVLVRAALSHNPATQ